MKLRQQKAALYKQTKKGCASAYKSFVRQLSQLFFNFLNGKKKIIQVHTKTKYCYHYIQPKQL